MIRTFNDRKTARFFEGENAKSLHSAADQLARRWTWLNNAEKLQDLLELRSNRFKALVGKRKGQHSKKNSEVFFHCSPEVRGDVEIVDHHSGIILI